MSDVQAVLPAATPDDGGDLTGDAVRASAGVLVPSAAQPRTLLAVPAVEDLDGLQEALRWCGQRIARDLLEQQNAHSRVA